MLQPMSAWEKTFPGHPSWSAGVRERNRTAAEPLFERGRQLQANLSDDELILLAGLYPGVLDTCQDDGRTENET